jgi:hypothetical protein
MPSGWLNLEAVSDGQLFDNEKPAFSFLGLTRTQRLYGFVGWYVCRVELDPSSDEHNYALLEQLLKTFCAVSSSVSFSL